jgi:hypothetical protein
MLTLSYRRLPALALLAALTLFALVTFAAIARG